MVRRNAVQGDTNWSSFNPSIMQALNGEYWMAFRSSNYKFTTDGGVVLTTENRVRNRTFIGRVNPETWLLDESTVKELDFSGLRFFARGPEDPRLYWDGKHYCLSMTILEMDIPVARICVVTLKSLEDPQPIDFKILPEMERDRVEKNWMPVHKTGRLAKSKVDFVYSPNTLVSKGQFVSVDNEVPDFRGGSQIIPLGDGTSIAIVHEVYDKYITLPFSMRTFAGTRQMRHYVHRFIRMDEDFRIIKYSEPFTFFGEGIEFAAGIAPTESGFVISYGRFDVACYMATISLGHALHSMK